MILCVHHCQRMAVCHEHLCEAQEVACSTILGAWSWAGLSAGRVVSCACGSCSCLLKCVRVCPCLSCTATLVLEALLAVCCYLACCEVAVGRRFEFVISGWQPGGGGRSLPTCLFTRSAALAGCLFLAAFNTYLAGSGLVQAMV